MLAETGIITTGLAFVLTVLATGGGLYTAFKADDRIARIARNAFILSLMMLTAACLVLIYAQLSGEYSITYVYGVSKDSQPTALKITALWGSQAGSLLFYTWMLNLFVVASLLLNWKSHYNLMGLVMSITGATLIFFMMLSVFFENPFERTWMSPSGEQDTVERAVFQPESKVVAYPWHVELSEQVFRDYSVSDTTPPFYPQAAVASLSRYDGAGLNPLLRHPGMVIHPPMLYLGFTGFILPFAFGMAALIRRERDRHWIQAVRRWTLVAWMFLSVGLILGGRWAYDVLGWGGYWGWDPVENSALLPWLTATAFLHSVMIQEKRGMLKGWNMSMIIATYLLVLLGTVATRTGLLSSVHTFAESPLAVPMGAFLSASFILSIGIYLWRNSQGYFASDHEIDGILSRESMFLFNNWIFAAITVFVFIGTWSEKITDFFVQLGLMERIINLGPEYYELPVALLFLVLYILMGVAPLVAWRRATASRVGRALRIPTALSLLVMGGLVITGMDNAGAIIGFGIVTFAGFATLLEIYKGAAARHRTHGENYLSALRTLVKRDQRRYGGYIIHLGVVIMGIGIIGSTIFQQETQQTLEPGDSYTLADYTMFYEEHSWAIADDGRYMQIASINVQKDGDRVASLRPRMDDFGVDNPAMTIAGTHSTVEGDFYVLYMRRNEGDAVTFQLYYNPLVNFVWWGSVLLVIGTLVAVYPTAAPEPVTRRRSIALSVPAGAGD